MQDKERRKRKINPKKSLGRNQQEKVLTRAKGDFTNFLVDKLLHIMLVNV